MSIRRIVLAGFAAAALASVASAQETATPAPAPAPSDAQPAPDADATMGEGRHGEKEYRERVNIVARKPLRHDTNWMGERDRTTWRTFTTWQGIRDERPMIARKTLGFHEPRPHIRRAERVERVSRGPLRGPAPSE